MIENNQVFLYVFTNLKDMKIRKKITPDRWGYLVYIGIGLWLVDDAIFFSAFGWTPSMGVDPPVCPRLVVNWRRLTQLLVNAMGASLNVMWVALNL